MEEFFDFIRVIIRGEKFEFFSFLFSKNNGLCFLSEFFWNYG